FILDIKSPDADPVIMANILSTLITSNNLLDKVTLYSTDRKYLDALPDSINKFENRHVTRKILTNAVMANDCKISAKRDKTQYHAFELRREVKVVEKFTLGKGASRAQLVWNQQAMDCFKKNSNSKILLIGINSAEDYQLAKDLGADYVMTDSPATAKNWR
ncbi:glycerophosphodiester phosphodiesterase, partial [Yersinia pestis]